MGLVRIYIWKSNQCAKRFSISSIDGHISTRLSSVIYKRQVKINQTMSFTSQESKPKQTTKKIFRVMKSLRTLRFSHQKRSTSLSQTKKNKKKKRKHPKQRDSVAIAKTRRVTTAASWFYLFSSNVFVVNISSCLLLFVHLSMCVFLIVEFDSIALTCKGATVRSRRRSWRHHLIGSRGGFEIDWNFSDFFRSCAKRCSKTIFYDRIF